MQHHDRLSGRRASRLFNRLCLLTLGSWLLLMSIATVAQPAGWTFTVPITVTENSGAALNGYQLRLTLDTASMISAGHLNADGSDLLFGADAQGTTLLPYYLESATINTAATVVWVKLGALPASASIGIFLFTGNPAATNTSTLNVFDYTNPLNNSATNQVNSGGAGGVTNSQRGFRFSPNQDILVTDFGKDEPTGTTRYVTLFDFATQAKLAQIQVSGPAATYTYAPLTQPIWLTAGTQYLLELYQGATDGYYFGTSSQINPLLTYFDMRYCNTCTQDSFPTNTLTNFHYGYPDFQFRTRQQITPAPTFTLGAGSTTTALSGATASVFGESVALTATVNGVFNPTGTVSFLDNASPLAGCGAPVPLSAGTAGCTTTQLSLGSHSITAAYSGDANDATSTSGTLTHVVSQASTTTAVTAPGPITLGQGVSVSATVSVQAPGSGTPTGAIAVSDGSASCNITLPAPSCTLTPTSAGTKTITAIYAGDANFAGSTGSTSLTVNAAGSGTTVSSNLSPSSFGQSVTFTATVTGSTPTGSVTFFDGATPLAGCTNPAPLASGVATCSVSTLGVGTHSITAAYSGDANNVTSTSAPFTQTVNGAATGTTLTSSASPSTFGQSVTFTATVTGNTPTGTVTFNDGANPLVGCTNPAPLASGVATCTVSTLSVGTHSVTAIYSGDANNATSTSAPFTQTVNGAATGTTLTSNASPTVFGQVVTFTATVGGNTPTGSVTFNDGANPVAGCTSPALLTSGVATCSVNTLGVGSHNITAIYSGDANNATSTSPPLTQVVAQAATTTTVAPPAPISLGQSVMVSVSVAVTAPGAGTPTGTIAVIDGSASCTITLPATSCSLTPTGAGVQTITATYSGDTNFSSSAGNASLTVNGVTPATVAATPALGRWALLLLVALLALAGAFRQRAKHD